MANFDVVSIGGAVRDFTFFTDQGRVFYTPENLTSQRMLAFEYGAKINPKEVSLTFGGGGSNSAVAFSRLGLKTAIISRVGNDEIGREVINNLTREKIDVSYLQTDSKAPTGLSFLIATDKKEREHIGFAYRGASQNLIFNSQQAKNLSSQWFYLTSLSGKDWPKNLKEIFFLAKSKGIKIMWNPGNFQLQAGKRALEEYFKQTQVLIVNKDEAIELALSGIKLGKRNPNFLNKPIYLLNILQEWGPKLVILTDGKKGAWAYDGRTIYHQKIIKSKAINTVGVGDAFGSAFLAGLIVEKNEIKKALKWGMGNSAAVLTKMGAQNGLLVRKKLLDKIKL
ncbi:MAG: carbohydrate kinase family protein [Candidatus Buchananbacteria bacterium]